MAKKFARWFSCFPYTSHSSGGFGENTVHLALRIEKEFYCSKKHKNMQFLGLDKKTYVWFAQDLLCNMKKGASVEQQLSWKLQTTWLSCLPARKKNVSLGNINHVNGCTSTWEKEEYHHNSSLHRSHCCTLSIWEEEEYHHSPSLHHSHCSHPTPNALPPAACCVCLLLDIFSSSVLCSSHCSLYFHCYHCAKVLCWGRVTCKLGCLD